MSREPSFFDVLCLFLCYHFKRIFHFYFPFRRFFCSLSICLMLFSGVGKSSGIVPPSSAIVIRILVILMYAYSLANPITFSTPLVQQNISTLCTFCT